MTGLTRLFSTDGWLADENGDGLPDAVRVRIILPRDVTPDVAAAAAELAARLGHETMALDLPLVLLEDAPDADDPTRPRCHILRDPAADPVEGSVEVDTDGGAVVRGATPAAIASALRRLARRPPSETERAAPTPGEIAPAAPLCLTRLYDETGLLADLDGDLIPDAIRARLLLGAGCGPAELAAAGDLAARLGLEATGLHLPLPGPHTIAIAPLPAGETPSVRIETDGGIERLVACGAAAARWLATAPGPADDASPVVQSRERVAAALTSIDRPPPPEHELWQVEQTLPWEVDDASDLIATRLLPRVTPGARVRLDVALSEPAAARRALEAELAATIAARGGSPEVHVRCALKPGFFWLTEEIAPHLRQVPDLDRVVIRCREQRIRPGQEWLSALMIREFARVDPAGAATLEARIAAMPPGERWLDPPSRWLLELYPAAELLPPDRARVSLELVAEQDEVYQVSAYDGAGALRFAAGFSPHWSERPYLDLDPTLGTVHPTTGWVHATIDGEVVIDERVATDLERVWDHYQREILPRLATTVQELAGDRPLGERRPLFAALTVEATLSEPDDRLPVREERVSGLEVLHEELYFVTLAFLKEIGRRQGGTAVDGIGGVVPWIRGSAGGGTRLRWTLRGFAGPLPAADAVVAHEAAATAIRVTGVILDGDGAPERLEMTVALADAAALTAAAARFAALTALPLATAISLCAPDATTTVTLPGGLAVRDPLAGRPPAPIARDRVIGYEEHLEILAGLRRLPGVRVWPAGRSFQGRVIACVEATLPNGGARTAPAKQAAWKPTLLLTARHHGNEPSSTTASLALVARLVTDAAWRPLLARLNLVVVPFENPDGAELAVQMQAEQPGWMLHAGRFNAFGLPPHLAFADPASPALEARVRPRVWRRWRPDLFLDDHGFPSHEWLQPFSGYIPGYPSYWLPRGLAYTYLHYLDDPAFPDHGALAERLRGLLAEEVARDPELAGWNRAWAEEYERYGHRWAPEIFPVEHYRDVVSYVTRTRRDPTRPEPAATDDLCIRYPHLTALSLVTEIADETAQGAYMDLCVRAHEAMDLACVRLLTESDPRLRRRTAVTSDGVYLWHGRERPVGPG